MATLASVYRYPIKSCLPIAESRCQVTSEGLAGDRRYMVVKLDGQFITARTHPQLQRVSVSLHPQGLTLQAPGMPELEICQRQFSGEPVATAVWSDSFTAPATHGDYDAWFTALLGEPARLLWLGETSPRYRQKLGQRVSFADGYPLLLLTSASLADLNRRTPEPQQMSQFRPNLVVSGTLPFAEDGWQRIRIGEVEFQVAKPCSRCVMTTLNPEQGEYHPGREPLATLATYRMGADGEIYFGQNLIPLNEGWLAAGDPVEVLQMQEPPHYAPRPRQPATASEPVAALESRAGTSFRIQRGEQHFQADGERPLLIQAEAAGLSWPHACRAGLCGRCKSTLLSGQVVQPETPGLSATAREEGSILTCCAIPRSDLLLAP